MFWVPRILYHDRKVFNWVICNETPKRLSLKVSINVHIQFDNQINDTLEMFLL